MIRKFKRFLVNIESEKSVISQLRKNRYAILYNFIQTIRGYQDKKNLKIIDIGGTPLFWVKFNEISRREYNYPILNNENIDIKIVNLSRTVYSRRISNNTEFIIGDGTNLPFKDDAFDLAVCHSVIEHVGSYENQKRIAEEIIRVSKNFFVQTPSYYIPIEPHFLFPYFQILPTKIKTHLTMILRGITDYTKARSLVESIRLLKKRELTEMFPKSILITEKLLIIPISYILIGGLDITDKEISIKTSIENEDPKPLTKLFKYIVSLSETYER